MCSTRERGHQDFHGKAHARTADALGISRASVSKYINRVRAGIMETPGKSRPKTKGKKRDVTEEVKCQIRDLLYEFAGKRQTVTVARLLLTIRERGIRFDGERATLTKVLKDMGFTYRRRDPTKYVVEEPHIVLKRIKFLKLMTKRIQEGRTIIYLDETWTYRRGTGKKKAWENDKPESCSRRSDATGERFIICHAGGKDGFVPGASLFVRSKPNPKVYDDYHCDMNGPRFQEWFTTQLLPNIPENSVIVMDNASYHSVRTEERPVTSWNKTQLQTWLSDHEVFWDETMTKKELLARCKLSAQPVKYVLDEYVAKNTTHEIIRLPPYHSIYNPIEMVWGIVKQKFDAAVGPNYDFSLPTTERVWAECLASVDADMWRRCVEHTERIMFEDLKRDVTDDGEEELGTMMEELVEKPSFVRQLFADMDLDQSKSDPPAGAEQEADDHSTPMDIPEEELTTAIGNIPGFYSADDEFNDSPGITRHSSPNCSSAFHSSVNQSKLSSSTTPSDFSSSGNDPMQCSSPGSQPMQCPTFSGNSSSACPPSFNQSTPCSSSSESSSSIFFPPMVQEWLDKDDKTLITKSGVGVKVIDLKRLLPKVWLNDVVIDFYLDLLVKRNPKDVYAFNTSFYQQWLKGYEKVQTWTKNVDIFTKKLLFIPLRDASISHWLLCVVFKDAKTIAIYDSMGGTYTSYLDSILQYLETESVARRRQPFLPASWTKEHPKNIPVQNNSWDCGVFVCTYADHLARNTALTFSTKDMDRIRVRLMEHIVWSHSQPGLYCNAQTVENPANAAEQKREVPRVPRVVETKTNMRDVLLHSSATIHQGHKRFPKARANAQCTAIATYFIATVSTRHVEVFTRKLLDDIIIGGDQYYAQCKQRKRIEHIHLNTEDLSLSLNVLEIPCVLSINHSNDGELAAENRIRNLTEQIMPLIAGDEWRQCSGGYLFIASSKTVGFAIRPSPKDPNKPNFFMFNSHCVDRNNRYSHNERQGAARLFRCFTARALAQLLLLDLPNHSYWQLYHVLVKKS